VYGIDFTYVLAVRIAFCVYNRTAVFENIRVRELFSAAASVSVGYAHYGQVGMKQRIS
jgi:hypothetical protein